MLLADFRTGFDLPWKGAGCQINSRYYHNNTCWPRMLSRWLHTFGRAGRASLKSDTEQMLHPTSFKRTSCCFSSAPITTPARRLLEMQTLSCWDDPPKCHLSGHQKFALSLWGFNPRMEWIDLYWGWTLSFSILSFWKLPFYWISRTHVNYHSFCQSQTTLTIKNWQNSKSTSGKMSGSWAMNRKW